MLFGSELSPFVSGVGVATIIVLWCVLPYLCVSTNCTYGMEPVMKASMIEKGILFSSGDISAPVAVRRKRASAAWCLIPAIWITSKSSLDKRVTNAQGGLYYRTG